jgi:CHASE2 domain-containing sensor protein
MSGQLPSAIKKLSRFAVILAASLLITGVLFASGVIRYWDKVLYDLCINNRVLNGPEKKNPLIANVDLNDASIETLGETLDTRRAFTDILEVLTDSNSPAAFDFLFRNEKNGDGFAEAVDFAGDTVIAALAVDKGMMNTPNTPYRELTETEKTCCPPMYGI